MDRNANRPAEGNQRQAPRVRFCAGLPADRSKILWSDGSGKAACGQATPHRAHTFEAAA